MRFVVINIRDFFNNPKRYKGLKLTRNEFFIVKFIIDFEKYYGRSPTYEEITKLFKKNAINVLLADGKIKLIKGEINGKEVDLITVTSPKIREKLKDKTYKELAEEYLEYYQRRFNRPLTNTKIDIPIKIIW